MLRFLWVLGMVGVACAVRGQSPGYIDTVEVSSAQIPLRIQETGRNITVITPRMIRELPAVSIDEILQLIPGVEIQSRGGFGVQANIIMRGSTFTQTLILVDGMRLNDPLTGHFNGYIPVVKEEIERIEVLRGPAAAMYGPDAVGGLIHIVTKTFAGTVEEGISGMAEVGYGSNSHVLAETAVIGAKEGFSWSLAAMTSRSDGEAIEARVLEDQTVLDPFHTFFNLNTVGGSLAWTIKPGWRLMARSSLDYRNFNARYFYSNIPADESTETVAQSFSVVHLEQTTGKRRSDLQMAYKYNSDVFEFSPRFPSTNEHTTQYANLLTNHLWELRDGLMVKAGAQVDHRQIESNDRGNHSDWHAGVYTMAMYRPAPNMHLTGSLRADQDQNYGLEVLPQLNASWIKGRWVLRAAAGRSIRAADYTERFVSNNLPNLTPGRSLGNPDLMAEVSWSQELGFDVQLGEGLQVKTTGFFRQSERLIDYVPTASSAIGEVGDLQPDATYFFATNITDVKTRGLEMELTYSAELSESARINLMAGYTYTETGNRDEVVSVYIANHARHLATWSARYQWKGIGINLSALYKARDARAIEAIGAALTPDYLVWNTRLSSAVGKKVTLSFQVQNIFDVDYQNILGAPMPGRWLIGSVGVRF